MTSLRAQMVKKKKKEKNLCTMQENPDQILAWEDPLEMG